ncbi:hypothetical protein MLOOGBEN_06470 [Bacillus sp. EB106-08-02-XG196]|uniref:hypothetical protein n=1 Tax=Bacillus sp. EB106-08-02-XG196 TaxID=2737049 RepID=UPI0015C465A3|nr:hypothetical protein [Bacillus sp. EB106-08-02-XG196]NWQ40343.1 hypothetical protein [Bacillus sp. EB106-08-02-XG196]
MKTNEEILKDLKNELIRIGSTRQRDYDLSKKKNKVYSTTICRRLKLSWPELVKQTGLHLNKGVNM